MEAVYISFIYGIILVVHKFIPYHCSNKFISENNNFNKPINKFAMSGWMESKNVIALWILLCATQVFAQKTQPCCDELKEGNYDAFYDFPRRIIKNAVGVDIDQKFVGYGCSTRGVLRIKLFTYVATQRRVKIDLGFSKPQGMVFNLGDSNSNNGVGGDDGSQSRDAELRYYDNEIIGYANEHYGNAVAFTIPEKPMHRLTLLVADQHIAWVSDCNITSMNYYSGDGWFALNGQPDLTGESNYEIYLGANRPVGTKSNYGSGLCQIGIKYETAY